MIDYAKAHRDFDIDRFDRWLQDHRVGSRGMGRNRKYFCPFHDDGKTPNGTLYAGKDGVVRYNCFACGERGDIVDLASTPELNDKHLLAQYGGTSDDRTHPQKKTVHKAGNDAPRTTSTTPDDDGRSSNPAADTPMGDNRHADQWNAWASSQQPAVEYWTGRGISQQTIDRLRLTVAPGDDPHYPHRLIIPFLVGDIVERITSRSPDGSAPRWKDPPGQKRLYKPACPDAPDDLLIVTEGPSDAIAVTDAGWRAVGVLGAHVWRDDHANDAIWQGRKIAVVGDGDTAGAQFAEQVAASLCAAGHRVLIVPAPEGQDLADLHADDKLAGWLVDNVDCAAWPERWPGLRRITPDTPIEAVTWLVPGWMPGGGLTLIFGDPATGKSWLGADLAAAVAAGRNWLGCPTETQGAAVVFDWENPGPVIKERCSALGAHCDNFHWREATGSLYDDTYVGMVQQFLAEVQPQFVFFDSLSRAFPGLEENDAPSVNAAMTLLMGLCRSVDAAGLVLHHANKTQASNRGYRVRGNSAILAAAEAAWETSKSKGQFVLRPAKMRNAEEPEPVQWDLYADPQHDRRLHVRYCGLAATSDYHDDDDDQPAWKRQPAAQPPQQEEWWKK